jgi:hypothetical protein
MNSTAAKQTTEIHSVRSRSTSSDFVFAFICMPELSMVARVKGP